MRGNTRKCNESYRGNVRLARQLWGEISAIAAEGLKELTARHGFQQFAFRRRGLGERRSRDRRRHTRKSLYGCPF